MKIVPFLFALAGFLVLGLWTRGFLGFIGEIEAMRDPGVRAGLEATDAVVVLTGGSERMTTGLALLESGNGKKLFISGVNKKLSLDKVLSAQSAPQHLRDCCIVLGYRADSTKGNAEETRDWLKAEGYGSIRLVTANYHMPRSLLLFHNALPDVTIVPHPVAPSSVKLQQWWLYPGTINLIATEYAKYLVAQYKVFSKEN